MNLPAPAPDRRRRCPSRHSGSRGQAAEEPCRTESWVAPIAIPGLLRKCGGERDWRLVLGAGPAVAFDLQVGSLEVVLPANGCSLREQSYFLTCAVHRLPRRRCQAIRGTSQWRRVELAFEVRSHQSSITLVGKCPEQARFTPLSKISAAEQQDGHAGHMVH